MLIFLCAAAAALLRNFSTFFRAVCVCVCYNFFPYFILAHFHPRKKIYCDFSVSSYGVSGIIYIKSKDVVVARLLACVLSVIHFGEVLV